MRAGLALTESFGSDPELPPLRVGMAAGAAVALHGDYYGDVVNLAARLVKASEPSQLVVSESVRDAVGRRFAFERIPELRPKGFDAAIAAFSLMPTDG